MAININLDKIFEALEDKAYEKIVNYRNNLANCNLTEEEDSKQKAKFPEIIAEECMGQTEDIHGGNENAKEVDIHSNRNKDDNEMVRSKLNIDEKKQEVINKMRYKFEPKKNYSSKSLDDIIQDITKEIVRIVNELSKKYPSNDKKTGFERYDLNAIAKHIATNERNKILNDKYDKRDGRKVQFFIDTSGSNYYGFQGVKEAIMNLNKKGYTCYVADCGNGFKNIDLEDIPEYNTKEKLEEFKGAIKSKPLIPTIETAKKMAEDVDFSVILADFDGLTSISKLSDICSKDKIPYLINTEVRYSWKLAAEHNWVDPEHCTYPKERIFDICPLMQEIDDYYEFLNYDMEERGDRFWRI